MESSLTDRFIHFGCWNNLNKKGKLLEVMNLLNEYIMTKNDVKFIIVAGDNYYPDKKKVDNDKKKKIIFTDKLIQGFNILPKTIEIDMILGNHDLENDKFNEELFVNENGTEYSENGTCKITQLEKDSAGENENINLILFKKRLINDTLILLIDTSLYSSDEEVTDYLKCYELFLGNEIESIESLRNYQNEFIYNSIRENRNIKNLIMVGHHPITGFKMKKNKNKLMNDIPNFYNVLRDIYKLNDAENINYYYLCADYHSYQSGDVVLRMNDGSGEMKIRQYICGTGGTELDDNLDYNDSKLNGINLVDQTDDFALNYQMIENICDNGFLDCEINGDEIKFTFIRLTNVGGRKKIKMMKTTKTKRRYKRNKQTYKKCKRNGRNKSCKWLNKNSKKRKK